MQLTLNPHFASKHPSFAAWMLYCALALIAGLFLSFGGPLQADETPAKAGNPYAQQIRPLLVKYCVGCHNPSDAQSNLRLDSLAAIEKGGDAGPAITRGDLDSSLIWRRVSGLDEPQMPPEDSPQPSSEEKEILKLWIERGAEGEDAPLSLQDQWRLLQAKQASPTKSNGHNPKASAITAAIALPDASMLVGRYGFVERLPASEVPPQWTSLDRLDIIGKVSQLRLDPQSRRVAIASGLPGFGGQVTVIELDGLLSDTNAKDASQPSKGMSSAKVYRLEAHRDMLYSAVLHPKEPWVATAGYDRIIRLWNYQSGELLRSFEGHNGAVYDLDFDPSGEILASASADETIKIWRVDSGLRLDTFGQCEAEQYVVRILNAPSSLNQSKQTPNQESSKQPSSTLEIVACGADRRIRLWHLPSLSEPSVSPMRHAVFAHESTIHLLALSPDHRFACTSAQDNTLKIWDTQKWELIEVLPKSTALPTSLAWIPSTPAQIRWTTLNGQVHLFALPASLSADHSSTTGNSPSLATSTLSSPEGNQGHPTTVSRSTSKPPVDVQGLTLPALVEGVFLPEDRVRGGDWYSFPAKQGETLKIETIASRDKSPFDSHLEITDEHGVPILRTRLQAVRESYFTFRGKDSTTIDDFRLHRWEDMELNELLYASGEVVRLWLYPRGPDSGYKVYPGSGSRYTYFGTSPVAHALNEPAWIVRELKQDQAPIANGQPVFPVYYANDDDPQRLAGKDSVIFFTAPSDATYFVRVRDTRGLAAETFQYKLSIAPPKPRFSIKLETPEITLRPNVGAEFVIATDRFDGLNSQIEISFDGLPDGLSVVQPLRIQADQLRAIGQIRSTTGSLENLPKEFEVTLHAKSIAGDQEWTSETSPKIKVKVNEKPTMKLKVVDKSAPDDAPPLTSLRIKPGETISAKLVIERGEAGSEISFAGDISFGGDDSGRNLPHGCFVDNIGLNGLLIPNGQSTREVFITAAPIAAPQTRWFHLRANVDGNPTTLPIELIVQPVESK